MLICCPLAETLLVIRAVEAAEFMAPALAKQLVKELVRAAGNT